MSLPLYSSCAVCGVISTLPTDRLMDTVMCMRAIEMMVVQEKSHSGRNLPLCSAGPVSGNMHIVEFLLLLLSDVS